MTNVAGSAEPSNSDNDEVAELHRQMAARLRALAKAMLGDWALADDAVQDAFLLLTAKWSEIQSEHRVGWLVQTVQYSALNLRRTRKRQAGREQIHISEAGERYTVEAGQSALEVSEELIRVRTALEQLPEAQQQIVHMRLVEEKTFQQIAEQLNLPLGTVLSRMRLAVERLRSKLT